MKHKEFKIPFKLARHILKDGKHHSFKVWIAIKAIHGSHAHQIDIQHVSNLCQISPNAVYYHLDKLLRWNWIGSDGEAYFMRPVSFLCEMYKVKGKGYRIDATKELPEIQSVLFAMSVKHIVSYRMYAERSISRCKQAAYKIQQFNPTTLSVRLLSSLIGISVNMVHRLKMKCIKLGYLFRRKNKRLVLPYEHAYLFEYHHGSLFTKDRALWIRLSDDITTFF